MVGKICERGKSWVLTNDKLPHTSDALLYHIKRCHYQALFWRQAHVQHPVLPPPETVPVGWKMKETSLTPNLSLLPPVPKACEELISCTCLEQNFAVVRIPYIASCICKTSGEPCEPCRNMTFWETVDMGIKVTVAWHCFRPFKRLCTCIGVRTCFQITFWTTQYSEYTYWFSLFSVLLTKSLFFLWIQTAYRFNFC